MDLNIQENKKKNLSGLRFSKMGMDIAFQTRVFLFSVCFGFLAVIVYNILSSIARMFKHKSLALIISDLLFSVLCFLGAALFLLTEGKGRLEGYVLFGTALGATLFLLIFSGGSVLFCGKKAKK